MLPSYHRPYDARLLLLAVPGASMLWKEGRKTIPIVTGAAVVLTSDIPLAILSLITRSIDLSGMDLFSRLAVLPLVRPVPLVLLTLTAFYGFAYIKTVRGRSPINMAPAHITVHS